LQQSTPEARHAIYERARKALLGQLRNMQPPAPESAIERESRALDEAVARLEAEAAPVLAPEPPPVPEPHPAPEPSPDESSVRESLRPAAPKPASAEGGGLRRLGIILGALVLVLALVGVAAWKLRDRPEDLAKLAPAAPEASDSKAPGKIGERVGDSGAARPSGGANSAATLPVAYRAGLLVQAPAEPGGVKTYTGTALWKRDTVNRGPGQALTSVIHIDVDMPEAKLKASVTIEKNFDASLSFSHTMSVRFDPAADSPIGKVTAINVPEMRRDDAAKGVALSGLQVDIAPNVFLVGLASSAEAQNIEALKGPNWMDVPLSLSNGRAAKLTFEKGTGGDRLLADVLNEWKSQ
jgi:hypothetical protein